MATRREALGALTAAGVGFWAPDALAAAPPGAANVVVPFAMSYNEAWTSVKIDGHGWFKFILDTGAEDFSASRAVVRALDLKKSQEVGINGASGEAYLKSFIAQDVNIANVVHLQNTSILSVSEDLGADGLIPAAQLGVTRFDFVEKRMYLSHGKLTPPDGYEKLNWAVKGSRRNQLIAQSAGRSHIIKADLDGRTLMLLMDTGANAGLFLFRECVERERLWDAYGPGQEHPVAGVTGVGIARLVRAKALSLGSVRFDAPLVDLESPSDRTHGEAARFVDGLIGMEMLRRLDIAFEPVSSATYVRPNATFHDVERRDRSGMALALAGDKATVIVVVDGSPAQRAGIKPGDVVTGYAGGDGSFAGLNWKLSGPAGDEIDLELSRDGRSLQVSFKLEEPR